MKKLVKSPLISCVLIIGLLIGLVLFIGIVGPDIEVIPGGQIKSSYYSTIRDLGLLEEGEKIKFFYSDALWNIKDGFYFFTDKKVVIYSQDFREPAILITYPEIKDIQIEYDDSFWEDSQLIIIKHDGEMNWFPLSSEKGGDKIFFEALMATWKREISE